MISVEPRPYLFDRWANGSLTPRPQCQVAVSLPRQIGERRCTVTNYNIANTIIFETKLLKCSHSSFVICQPKPYGGFYRSRLFTNWNRCDIKLRIREYTIQVNCRYCMTTTFMKAGMETLQSRCVDFCAFYSDLDLNSKPEIRLLSVGILKCFLKQKAPVFASKK